MADGGPTFCCGASPADQAADAAGEAAGYICKIWLWLRRIAPNCACGASSQGANGERRDGERRSNGGRLRGGVQAVYWAERAAATPGRSNRNAVPRGEYGRGGDGRPARIEWIRVQERRGEAQMRLDQGPCDQRERNSKRQLVRRYCGRKSR